MAVTSVIYLVGVLDEMLVVSMVEWMAVWWAVEMVVSSVDSKVAL